MQKQEGQKLGVILGCMKGTHHQKKQMNKQMNIIQVNEKQC